MTYHLVTTFDEALWDNKKENLLLGSWCLPYLEKIKKKEISFSFALPYGVSKKDKDLDYLEIIRLEQKIFPILCEILNDIHAVNFSIRFWKILLGHWFRAALNLLINRINTIYNLDTKYKISSTTFYLGDYCLATEDTISFIWAADDDKWNNYLYKFILNKIRPEIKFNEKICFNKSPRFILNKNKKNFLLKNCLNVLNRLIDYLSSDSDGFFIHTYLPLIEESILQLSLFQIPRIRKDIPLNFTKEPDLNLRKGICLKLFERLKLQDNEALIVSLIFDLMPVCYVEDFNSLVKRSNDMQWPESPKFIFTSNSYHSDELFKIWAAQKVEKGSKYIIGQHGNNFGTYRYMNPSLEEDFSDKFLTWGWSGNLIQHTKTFIFKKLPKKYNSKGSILLIEYPLPQRIYTQDVSYEYETYFSEQLNFVSNLSLANKNRLIVRLHPIYRNTSSHEMHRWNDFDPSINLELGTNRINNLIKNSAIVVHSYDSTGILETLAADIPTIAFWQNGLDHLLDDIKPIYEKMVDVGIFHLSPDSASNLINHVIDNIDNWWNQQEIQEARISFCNNFARKSENRITEIKKILLES